MKINADDAGGLKDFTRTCSYGFVSVVENHASEESRVRVDPVMKTDSVRRGGSFDGSTGDFIITTIYEESPADRDLFKLYLITFNVTWVELNFPKYATN